MDAPDEILNIVVEKGVAKFYFYDGKNPSHRS